jgi:hypothetical protein
MAYKRAYYLEAEWSRNIPFARGSLSKLLAEDRQQLLFVPFSICWLEWIREATGLQKPALQACDCFYSLLKR